MEIEAAAALNQVTWSRAIATDFAAIWKESDVKDRAMLADRWQETDMEPIEVSAEDLADGFGPEQEARQER